MKILLFLLTVTALIFSIIWAINTNFDYEPVIVSITTFIALLGLFAYNNNSNTIKIKGNNNETYQDIGNSDTKNNSNNKIEIDTSGNKTYQDIRDKDFLGKKKS